MPTRGSCLNLITSGSNILIVNSITPSKAVVISLPVLYFSCTPSDRTFQFQEQLPIRKAILNFSITCNTTPLWIFHPQAQQFTVVIPIEYYDQCGWADCVDGFIQVVKVTDMDHIVCVGAVVGPAHLVPENAASDRIDSIWLVNHPADLNTYWTEY